MIKLKNILNEDKLSDLEKLLKSHDWSYEYSDDHSKYKRGSDQRGVILKLIKQLDSEGSGTEANALWKRYKKI
jgi:hypothetical protein